MIQKWKINDIYVFNTANSTKQIVLVVVFLCLNYTVSPKMETLMFLANLARYFYINSKIIWHFSS